MSAPFSTGLLEVKTYKEPNFRRQYRKFFIPHQRNDFSLLNDEISSSSHIYLPALLSLSALNVCSHIHVTYL